MQPVIRGYQQSDESQILEFALRAWEPVFDAVGELLGTELFDRLRGDWRTGQTDAVRDVLADPAQRVWVGEHPTGQPVGFVAAKLDRDSQVGEIFMIAVDPDAQGQGVGMALTQVATDWLRQSGMRVAMIDTGGDRGHAPARHLYQKAGYTALPAVRYFKSL